jgi:arabinofuranosyltransferase
MRDLGSFRRKVAPRSAATAVALCLAVGYLFWAASCIMGIPEVPWDDHYISYLYSRNLAEGHGLRFNAVDATPTEGYSSLTQVLLVAFGYAMRLDPLALTRGISLISFVLIPLLVGLPMARLLGAPVLSTLAVSFGVQILYFLTGYTAVVNLALGMETLLFMGSVACLAGWSLREFDSGASVAGSPVWRVALGCLATTLVLLGRPEGPALVIVTLATVFLARKYLFPSLKGMNDSSYLIVSAFAAFSLLVFFAWKKAYFGYYLPNAYYVKSHNAIMGMRSAGLPGWEDTKAFLVMIRPAIILGGTLLFVAGGPRALRKVLLIATLPGALMVLAYARAVHEAAYWYRYEFPFLVYLHLLLVGLLCLLAGRLRVLPLFLAPAAIICVARFSEDRGLPKPGPTAWLGVKVGQENYVNTAIGQDLARTELGQQATIAVTAAGAIPYFSRFRAVDLVGLNDNFLSGRTSRTLEEVWNYIDRYKPDVFQSGLPPASPGIGLDQFDPYLESPAVAEKLADRSVFVLQQYWDQRLLLETVRREALYLRDHYTFGGAYTIGRTGWVILYVRKDSPYRDRIRQTIRERSAAMDRETDLRPYFVNDPRLL